eukprot:359793-Chlamydomonas_euryale.AAC.19
MLPSSHSMHPLPQARADASSAVAQMAAQTAGLSADLDAAKADAMAARADADAARAGQRAAATAASAELEALRAQLSGAAAAASGASAARIAQLETQLAERDMALQRLQAERGFLQQQVDNLHRQSLSPGFHPLASGGGGHSGGVGEDAGAGMDIEEAEGPSRKRARVGAARGDDHAGTSGATDPAAAAAALPLPTVGPFSNDKKVERRTPASGGRRDTKPDSAVAASPVPAAAAARELPTDVSSMTVADMKGWLMESGFEDTVFHLNMKKAKKADWVKAVEEKCRS